jgi:hypothetical protein
MMSEAGEPETIEFKFHEAVHPCEMMARYKLLSSTGAGKAAAQAVTVPVFYAEGLTVEKDGARVRPVFFDVKVNIVRQHICISLRYLQYICIYVYVYLEEFARVLCRGGHCGEGRGARATCFF